MTTEIDDLEQYLADGWEIKGYSVSLFAAGAMSHHILLQKGIQLVTCVVMNSGAKEIGRSSNILCPKPARKPGFFG